MILLYSAYPEKPNDKGSGSDYVLPLLKVPESNCFPAWQA